MSADESELSVEKIFESFLEARARGGSPDEKDIYLKYPQHKHKLEAMFCALGRIDDCFRKIRDTSAEKTAEEVSLRNLRITGYRVLEKIGEGGMSSVFLAEQESLKRPVALKIMSASWSGDSKAIARFRREAETIAQLDHPGIVPIHEFGKDAGVYFLALEFIPGLSLADLIGYLKNRGVPERGTPVFDFMRARFEREKARITGYGLQPPCFDGSGFFWSNTYFDICAMVLRSLAAALESAHDKSIVHRDIKPSNIILTPNGRPHIIDFGLSSSQAATSFQSGHQRACPAGNVAALHHWPTHSSCILQSCPARRLPVGALRSWLSLHRQRPKK